MLAANATLSAVENKIPAVNYSVKKTDDEKQISDIESQYITIAYYNKITKNINDNSIKTKTLIDKSTTFGFINNTDSDGKK